MTKLFSAISGLGMIAAFLGFAALNIALIVYVFPDTLAGRSIAYFFSNDSEEIMVSELNGSKSFKCNNSVPEFTLGRSSDPTQTQLLALCDCIWNELPLASKEFAMILQDTGNAAQDTATARVFATSVGIAMRSCGAMELS